MALSRWWAKHKFMCLCSGASAHPSMVYGCEGAYKKNTSFSFSLMQCCLSNQMQNILSRLCLYLRKPFRLHVFRSSIFSFPFKMK
uniref:Putative secreted protein ovary overexpressed n=1 Tax=Rhipicephalus microplus TaxID=6941 RepID=A0A6M2DAM3_RHIMP